MRSSTESLTRKRTTCNGVDRPSLWARLTACASTAGFHQRSNNTTRSAEGMFRPTPPARSDISSTRDAAFTLKC